METFALCVVFAGVSVWLIAKAFPRRHSSELPSPESRTKHQAEYQEALDEIVRLDAELETCRRERAEFEDDNYALTQSIEHTLERLRTSEQIRQKLAAILSGRCCGGQITMGNTEAKVVHGSVVVSDPGGFPSKFGNQLREIMETPDPDASGGFLDICNSERRDDITRTECCETCRAAEGRIRDTMILCPICGNKRCPKADNHRYQCSGSNATGQVGVFGDTDADSRRNV